MKTDPSRQGLALYLAVVSIVTGSLLVLAALQLADTRTRGARQWSKTMEMAALLHTRDLSGSSTDSAAMGEVTITIDSGVEVWIRDRVRRLDDSVFSRLVELGTIGSGTGNGARWSGRLTTWCRGADSLAVPRPLCPLTEGRFGLP